MNDRQTQPKSTVLNQYFAQNGTATSRISDLKDTSLPRKQFKLKSSTNNVTLPNYPFSKKKKSCASAESTSMLNQSHDSLSASVKDSLMIKPKQIMQRQMHGADLKNVTALRPLQNSQFVLDKGASQTSRQFATAESIFADDEYDASTGRHFGNVDVQVMNTAQSKYGKFDRKHVLSSIQTEAIAITHNSQN